MKKAAQAKTKPKETAPKEQQVLGQDIEIIGARMHNLQQVTVTIPRNRLVVVTGVSGSGKSSLTIDTLYAEGQRRYAESLSAYARQFLMRMNKPDVEQIKGLCPAIAIEQKVITRTPRSTVGSMTELYDYLRLLYARIGETISPISGRKVKKQDVADVLAALTTSPKGSRWQLLTPFRWHGKRNAQEELSILVQKGFSRLYHVQEGMQSIEELQEDANWQPDEHSFVLVDRVVIKEFEEDDLHRLTDSISTAFYEGEGICYLAEPGGELIAFSNKFELDGMSFEEPQPNLFSYNNPFGACPTCEGFGQVLGIDKDLVIPDPRLSIYEGAVAPWKGEKLGWWREQFMAGAAALAFPVHKPIMDLSKEQYQLLWKGKGNTLGIDAFFREVEQNLYKVQYRVLLSRYRGRTTCPECEGYRLRKEALCVKIAGKHIGELVELPVKDLYNWFTGLEISAQQQAIAKRVLIEIHQRLQTLLDVGLGYLTLSRLANTLSGGESQRIQLTRNLGSNLTNSLYILDEPSIGLHPRDTARLIKVLKQLRDLGNTVVVVEHDEMMMREADYIIDMGPQAGHLGGKVMATGNYDTIIQQPESLTAKYLTGELTLRKTRTPRAFNRQIVLEEVRHHNLKNITVAFPLNVLTVICGVSGSGKTTLVKQVLVPALQYQKGVAIGEKAGPHKAISGNLDAIAQVEMVDQNPIGKSSRSNPVTYVKAWDEIRNLFALQPLSKMRGFQPKHFSFNVDGGRCDACKGDGEQIVEMQFLADVHLTCEVCGGKRFKEEVLEVTINGKNVFEILELSVDESIAFFSEEKNIVKALKPLQDVGLGYVKLGQSSDTLSGGEAQRIKLASFLGKGKSSGHVLFVFDEPTTGLHFHDIQKLLMAFQALIEQGHSILVIEHNTDVIANADWLIELGPDAGIHGGELVYAGIPNGIKKVNASATAPYL